MMMKINSDHRYYEITSFEDFRIEKQRLILKSKLIEVKINMEIILIRELFSISNLVLSFAREFIVPKISGILEEIMNLRNSRKD
jgi:hypothetical protein